ncbi:hypothetical protein R0131_07725 [Clostridium sp. AL.422]|uniref:hypothetical protein n=1 Tax=Clostridium TaxID=1485 RepID=UPI00293DEE71|nr:MULTISPECIES: hypothetical protein [unclassified Clostridium]MDV4150724.1 hypothetical protein [Clostridium sp. AL.422]
MPNEKNNHNRNEHSYVGYGIAFGLLGGTLFSIIINLFFKSQIDWTFEPGLGMLIGIIIGSIMDQNKNKK